MVACDCVVICYCLIVLREFLYFLCIICLLRMFCFGYDGWPIAWFCIDCLFGLISY